MNRTRFFGVLAALVILLSAVGGAVAAYTSEPAKLHVEQPSYVEGDVTTSKSGNLTTYHAQGERLFIAGQNFNDSAVVDAGAGNGATLRFDEALGVWEFSADKSGTYETYWIVEERRQVTITENNSTTQAMKTVRVRYAARINVSATDLDHVPAGTVEQRREDAANWSSWVDAVRSERVAGADANVEQQTQLAINLLRLRHHPTSALTGNFTATLLLLFTTLGGFLVLLLWATWHYLTRRSDILENRERRMLDEERADLEDHLSEFEREQRLSALEGMDWNDIFADSVARSMRDAFGDTVLDGWLAIQDALQPRNLVRDRLQAMSDSHVAVETAETDGGAENEPRGTGSFHLAPMGSEAADVPSERVHSLTDPSDEVIDGLAWDDPELMAVDLVDADLDADGLDTALSGPTLDELVDRYDVDLARDFDGDREVFAQYLAEFLASVHEHDMTDAQGRVRPIRLAFNVLLRGLREVSDRHEIPLAHYQSEHIEMLLAGIDQEQDVEEYVNRVTEGRYT